MATIDIVVPCYNYCRFLNECVESVLSQSVPDLRVLIIDDASPDGSAEVARQIAAKDSRVETILHRRNRGHIATYNEGIDWARSDYFLLLSADDLVAPGALGRATRLMERFTEVSFTHGAEISFDSDSLINLATCDVGREHWVLLTSDEALEAFFRSARNTVGTSTAVIRTAAQKTAGHYNPDLPHAGDLDMWLRLSRIGSVAETTAVQGLRRLHPLNMSKSYDHSADVGERRKVFQHFLATGCQAHPKRAFWQAKAEASMAEELFRAGEGRLRKGDLRALSLMTHSMRMHSMAPLLAVRSRFRRRQWPLRRLRDGIDFLQILAPAKRKNSAERTESPVLATAADFEVQWLSRRIRACLPQDTTHVLIAPWLVRGGADLAVIRHAEYIVGTGAKVAVLLTVDADSHWISRLPQSAFVAQIGAILAGCSDRETARALAIALVETSARVIHIIQSAIGRRVLCEYGEHLSRRKQVFMSLYCDRSLHEDMFAERRVANLLSQIDDFVAGYITDNQTYADLLAKRNAIARSKLHVVYLPTADTSATGAGANDRVMWAGRLDRQKRPDLILAIAKLLPSARFDIYGSGVLAKNWPQNVSFKGAYDGFYSLPIHEYGCFLYTSGYDGLPNVLLEAGARGMPVVASDVGGVKELINANTGWLVAGNSAGAFASSIRAALEPGSGLLRGMRLRELVRRRHTRETFFAAMDAIPAYSKPSGYLSAGEERPGVTI